MLQGREKGAFGGCFCIMSRYDLFRIYRVLSLELDVFSSKNALHFSHKVFFLFLSSPAKLATIKNLLQA